MTVFRAGRAVYISVICASAVSGPGAFAEDPAAPTAFLCEFTTGTSTSFEAGSFASKGAAPLTFQLAKIDLEGQSAELTSGTDAKPAVVRIIRAINANHYLEAVNEGFLNLTTVYDKQTGSDIYPAVHSRHFGLVGQPVFAQYSGTCKAK